MAEKYARLAGESDEAYQAFETYVRCGGVFNAACREAGYKTAPRSWRKWKREFYWERRLDRVKAEAGMAKPGSKSVVGEVVATVARQVAAPRQEVVVAASGGEASDPGSAVPIGDDWLNEQIVDGQLLVLLGRKVRKTLFDQGVTELVLRTDDGMLRYTAKDARDLIQSGHRLIAAGKRLPAEINAAYHATVLKLESDDGEGATIEEIARIAREAAGDLSYLDAQREELARRRKAVSDAG